MFDIPTYPEFRELQREDQRRFERYFHRPVPRSGSEGGNPPVASDYTFTNFYTWRHSECSRVSCVHNNTVIYAAPKGRAPFFFMPLGTGKIAETLLTCAEYMRSRKETPRFNFLTADMVKQHFGPPYRIEEQRANFDYVYRQDRLVALSGRKFDGKRNRLKKFLKNHSYTYQPLTSEYIAQCVTLLEIWNRIRQPVSEEFPKLREEKHAVIETLVNFEWLKLRGGMILVGGKVEAFSIGEALNPNTLVTYIEKSNPEMEGLAQLINREFARHAAAGFTYINREDDLGEPGLRRAKMSYYPDHFIHKYAALLP